MAKGAAQKRYLQLESAREPFLTRARDCSKLTIPAIVPPQSHSSSATLPTPFQSIGARGVNNLANKLILALLPPNSPILRMVVADDVLEEIMAMEGSTAEVETALSKYERSVMKEIESAGDRNPVFEGFKHLVIAGNVLLYIGKDGLRVFHLHRYVCKRDPMGNAIEIVTREDVAPEVFRKYHRFDAALVDQLTRDGRKDDETVEVYTHIKRLPDKWEVYQETNGLVIPETRGTFPLDKSPYIPLRWTRIDGEDYGRGHVEEYFGDLKSLEALTRAIVEGAAAAAKVLFLVNPNGTTQQRVIAEAPNGAVRSGNSQDVTVLQLNKYADFRVAKEIASEIEQRLSFAFLLNSTVQRSAERVTAEEIRYVASELEDALGGLYSLMSSEFQLPYVKRRIALAKGLPKLPANVVNPVIITGIEALGRGQDLRKLDLFVGDLLAKVGEQGLARLNMDEYLRRRAAALSMDVTGLLKTDEQVAEEQKQAQMTQMVDRLGPEAMKQIGGMAADQTKGTTPQ
ncbi:MAG: portal protein [Parvibaculum sp.]|uniref:portal protein n=1 Tax=Parvibaculum sp. TaxID=2024848 RepID=UPI002728CAD4|nr:portal protein [Parvibaculum sp.]MDO8839657.1 portal protein [Parvibaculum sp.]